MLRPFLNSLNDEKTDISGNKNDEERIRFAGNVLF
jgi:hypothetical protein